MKKVEVKNREAILLAAVDLLMLLLLGVKCKQVSKPRIKKKKSNETMPGIQMAAPFDLAARRQRILCRGSQDLLARRAQRLLT